MASGLENIETIESPFRRFVTTIGIFPTAFTDAMTYYECLAYLVKYLEDTVIPAVNENAEALQELQNLYVQLKSYVDHYFDNLDIQEEINNKIDSMVDNGTFQEILDVYVTPTLDQMNNTIAINKTELEGKISTERNSRTQADNNLQSQINGLASGAPIPVSSVDAMTDTSKIYVNTTNGYWYYYDGDSWEQGGVYQASQVETDTTLTEAGVPADAKATGEAINQVKDLTTISIPNQRVVEYPVTAPRTAGYIGANGSTGSSETLEYFYLDVEEGDQIIADPNEVIRFVCAYVNGVADASLGVNSGTTSYTVPATVTRIAVTMYNDKQLQAIYNNKTIVRNKFPEINTKIAVGTLTNGSDLKVEIYSALKDGYAISAYAVLTTFGSLRLGFNSPAHSISNYIDVTSDSLIIKNANNDPQVFAHGLTIAEDITIKFTIHNGLAKIVITSKGVSYEKELEWVQINSVIPYPILISDGTVASLAKLSVDIPAAKRELWIFGDSYLGVRYPNRWPYYLVQDGLSDNALLNGSAGSTTAGSVDAISTLIAYGTPKYAILATGMNDGGDVQETPSLNWTRNKDRFLAYCSANNIIPILSTTPTVATVYNEAKNTWVRNSGYRYIDFAKAVGANNNGIWYSGMLSSDNVHPTELGAKALYNQVLVDLPEIFG